MPTWIMVPELNSTKKYKKKKNKKKKKLHLRTERLGNLRHKRQTATKKIRRK